MVFLIWIFVNIGSIACSVGITAWLWTGLEWGAWSLIAFLPLNGAIYLLFNWISIPLSLKEWEKDKNNR